MTKKIKWSMVVLSGLMAFAMGFVFLIKPNSTVSADTTTPTFSVNDIIDYEMNSLNNHNWYYFTYGQSNYLQSYNSTVKYLFFPVNSSLLNGTYGTYPFTTSGNGFVFASGVGSQTPVTLPDGVSIQLMIDSDRSESIGNGITDILTATNVVNYKSCIPLIVNNTYYFCIKIIHPSAIAVDLATAQSYASHLSFFVFYENQYTFFSRFSQYLIETYYTSSDEQYNQGYEDGYSEGVTDGNDAYLNEGYNTGFSDGHLAGYNEGYGVGYAETNLSVGWLQNVVNGIFGVFAVEILPGVSLSWFVFVPLVLGSILFIMKVFLG